ncbi:hypothetical protein J6590_092951 [Homalodisca vitripennis]|nr:hypothetical protein J6590_092951 [Homalodisca vitripennis]
MRTSAFVSQTAGVLKRGHFLSDSECNNIESSSDSEEPVDDTDSDPTYKPNASSTSSFVNRAVLSSDSEDECDVDDPRPGPSNQTQAPTRPRRLGRPSHRHPITPHPISSDETDSELIDSDNDGW